MFIVQLVSKELKLVPGGALFPVPVDIFSPCLAGPADSCLVTFSA